ncbi:MAG TPA: hypothetical protein VK994_06870 [Bacteroidales bacterium]|nr:hypothetical protein [Bacteroidales bacterium]
MTIEHKKDILRSVREYLTNEGFEEIMTDLDDSKKPKKIVEEQTGNIYQPDLVALDDGSSHIFQIVHPDNLIGKSDRFIRECSIFERHAAAKNGKLYLIVPIQYFEKTIGLINNNNLENIGILQISN